MSEEKIKLLNLVFGINENSSEEEIYKIENKIKDFLKENGKDEQLEDSLIITNMRSEMISSEKVIKSGATRIEAIDPIVERLKNKSNWDKYDLFFSLTVIGNTKTYEIALELIEKALKSEHINDNNKIVICTNMSLRLLIAKYKEQVDLKKVTEEFNKFVDFGLELCKINEDYYYNFTLNLVLTIRRNLFDGDEAEIRTNLKTLKAVRPVFILMRSEYHELRAFLSRSIEKSLKNQKLGKNLREFREERGITLADLADLLGISSTHLADYEKGFKNTPVVYIYKISKILGYTIEEIFNGVKETSESSKERKVKTLAKLASQVSEEEVDLLINAVTEINKIINNRHS
ncbi:MAG: helix-turn-helix transcriptional regulator [Defluviitaleaceae bacterium]|nr:helix-turn-helix transcriptional regulator [Defluviitaleaceae bacterium]